MTTNGYWADPPYRRDRTPLFVPTLDSMVFENDPVRLLDEVLDGVDWSSWEAEYCCSGRGHPPIHPRFVAAAILYGLIRGIRSSRKLEENCSCRIDFIWLLEGRRLDHTTISKFRTRFHRQLKELFKQIGRIAMSMGLIRLCEVAFDGTRSKANNSRYNTRTAKTLEEKLQALDELYERLIAEANTFDAEHEGLGSPTKLPDDLADVERRRQQILAALEKAQAADEARRQQGIDPDKKPCQVPLADPDSRVMPNKEGGFAPNYTPVCTTDGHGGFIVDADVLSEVNETSALIPSLDRIAETFGQMPEKLLTDAGNNSGQVMAEAEARGVEFYAPVESNQPQPGNPACRADPTQPVPESEWDKLPRNSRGKLDKSCFVYDAEQDQYYCPQGQPMPKEKTKPDQRGGVRVILTVYRCLACACCPLAAACLSDKNERGRTITRDEHEQPRERTAARMGTESAKKLYNQRPRIAETTFGILKSVMGMRQFLLRGLEKVKTEWCWATTAFNLMKLVRWTAKLRAEGAALAAPSGS